MDCHPMPQTMSCIVRLGIKFLALVGSVEAIQLLVILVHHWSHSSVQAFVYLISYNSIPLSSYSTWTPCTLGLALPLAKCCWIYKRSITGAILWKCLNERPPHLSQNLLLDSSSASCDSTVTTPTIGDCNANPC